MNQQIILPRIILRTFVQNHTEWIFLYGSDFAKKGCLGQMWQLHGEPNTFPIFTCNKMCPSSSSKYWQDFMYDEVVKIIENCIKAIPQDGRPIIPLRKIGEGNSQMKFMAPKCFEYMKARLEQIKYKQIKIDYTK